MILDGLCDWKITNVHLIVTVITRNILFIYKCKTWLGLNNKIHQMEFTYVFFFHIIIICQLLKDSCLKYTLFFVRTCKISLRMFLIQR